MSNKNGILEINFKKKILFIVVHDLDKFFRRFYSRGDEPVPPRERAGGVKGDGASIEEEVIRTFCGNC